MADFFLKLIRTVSQETLSFFNSMNGKIIVLGIAVIIVLVAIKKIWELIANIRQHQKLQKTLAALMPSADRDKYIIEGDDY